MCSSWPPPVPNKRKADQTLTQLKAMQKACTIELIDDAVLVKWDDGKLKINDLDEFTPPHGPQAQGRRWRRAIPAFDPRLDPGQRS